MQIFLHNSWEIIPHAIIEKGKKPFFSSHAHYCRNFCAVPASKGLLPPRGGIVTYVDLYLLHTCVVSKLK